MNHEGPQEPFTRLSVADAKRMIDNGGVQVVDVRESGEYREGHIPGAEHIPVAAVFARRGELSRDRDIVFVCAVGQRSALACEMAAAAGLTRLFNMEGGTQGWIEEGHPIEK